MLAAPQMNTLSERLRTIAPAWIFAVFCTLVSWRMMASRGYRLPDTLDRVYENARARKHLNWQPRYDFARILAQIDSGAPIGSDLSRAVGIKGYHGAAYSDGLYPVD